MDSIKRRDTWGLATWKALLGGALFEGYVKIAILLAVFLLVGGLTLAQWA